MKQILTLILMLLMMVGCSIGPLVKFNSDDIVIDLRKGEPDLNQYVDAKEGTELLFDLDKESSVLKVSATKEDKNEEIETAVTIIDFTPEEKAEIRKEDNKKTLINVGKSLITNPIYSFHGLDFIAVKVEDDKLLLLSKDNYEGVDFYPEELVYDTSFNYSDSTLKDWMNNFYVNQLESDPAILLSTIECKVGDTEEGGNQIFLQTYTTPSNPYTKGAETPWIYQDRETYWVADTMDAYVFALSQFDIEDYEIDYSISMVFRDTVKDLLLYFGGTRNNMYVKIVSEEFCIYGFDGKHPCVKEGFGISDPITGEYSVVKPAFYIDLGKVIIEDNVITTIK